MPRKVLWWASSSREVEEWAVRVIQGMYPKAQSHVWVKGQYSEEFNVGVGVHQGSLLSPLLFFLVLEAMLREFHTGAPWELLYTDDLVFIADTQEDCISMLKALKAGMENKGLCVIMKKTKFPFSGDDQDVLQKSGKYPCTVCCSGVGRNSILCSQCMLWVHKTCSGITKRLVEDPNYISPRCKWVLAHWWPHCDWNGCRRHHAWFRSHFLLHLWYTVLRWGLWQCRCCQKLLPVLTFRHLSPKICGKVYVTCVCSAVFHGSKTWGPTPPELRQLCCNHHAMICWICGIKDRDETPSTLLIQKLDTKDITSVLCCRRLRWYGHVQRAISCIKSITNFQIPGTEKKGRPRKICSECVKTDVNKFGCADINPLHRDAWRTGVQYSLVLQTP